MNGDHLVAALLFTFAVACTVWYVALAARRRHTPPPRAIYGRTREADVRIVRSGGTATFPEYRATVHRRGRVACVTLSPLVLDPWRMIDRAVATTR